MSGMYKSGWGISAQLLKKTKVSDDSGRRVRGGGGGGGEEGGRNRLTKNTSIMGK